AVLVGLLDRDLGDDAADVDDDVRGLQRKGIQAGIAPLDDEVGGEGPIRGFIRRGRGPPAQKEAEGDERVTNDRAERALGPHERLLRLKTRSCTVTSRRTLIAAAVPSVTAEKGGQIRGLDPRTLRIDDRFCRS